jgi:C4-dicarboxylate transporter, DctM subunit
MLEALLFAALLLAGVPIAFVFGLVSLFYGLRVGDIDFFVFPQQMFIGVNKFVLMSIPFFILAGNLMNKGGITRRLVALALALLGFVRGGLALSSVLAGIMFSELTGSAQASAAAIGSVMIPSMKDRGYDAAFASAVVSATAVLAPIIPPSISMIIYGAAGNVSIGALFAAGIVPGLIAGICLLLATYWYAVRSTLPKEQPFAVRRLLQALRESTLALMAPVVILGGIWSGAFTPTEAAAVAVGYSLVVGLLVYRELKLSELPKIFLDSGVLATSIMFIMGAATIFAWILTYAGVPEIVTRAASGLQDPYLFLLLVNLLVLFLGMWMDPTATIVVLTPILLPIAESLGIHPVHFGVVFVYNLMIGLATPPVGYILYVACAIGGRLHREADEGAVAFSGSAYRDFVPHHLCAVAGDGRPPDVRLPLSSQRS